MLLPQPIPPDSFPAEFAAVAALRPDLRWACCVELEFTWPFELTSNVCPAAAQAAPSTAYKTTRERIGNQFMGVTQSSPDDFGAGVQISCALMPVYNPRLVCG